MVTVRDSEEEIAEPSGVETVEIPSRVGDPEAHDSSRKMSLSRTGRRNLCLLGYSILGSVLLLSVACRPNVERDEGAAPPPESDAAHDDETGEREDGERPREPASGLRSSGQDLYWERASDDEPIQDRPRAVGPPVSMDGALPSLAPLVEGLTATVVGVTTRTRRARPGPPLPPGIPRPPSAPDREEIGIGSGVLIDPEGLVLTNHHVVADAATVEVRLADDRQFEADVLGADPETDIAVLRLRGVDQPLPAATLGRSDDLRVGDYVVAIGNPFGLSLTVTAGIVSAMARVIGTSPFDDFLQTDAAINPGNSGGPLFDLNGRLVGINTAIVAPGEGIGFAVPIDLVRALLPQIVQEGRVVRGYLGVVIQNLTPQLAEEIDAGVERGAMIVALERQGPAERAGLMPGDIIVVAEDEEVVGAASLSRQVARMAPGDTVDIVVLRNGERLSMSITLDERPPRRDLTGGGR